MIFLYLSFQNKMTEQVIYTDGSCTPNPGRGGWGFILVGLREEPDWFVNGGSIQTTNNQMEVMAVIEALKFCNGSINRFKIFSDSQYVINCAQGKWKRKKNMDLWKKFDIVSKGKTIRWEWVKAHNGDHYNEKVDLLAKSIIV
jgi:ribonuclease HI